jgi:uncharacterized protein
VLDLLLTLAVVTAAPVAAPPVCIAPDGTRIHLDLAISDQERALGLMFRDSLPADRGMLFVFTQDDRWPFWMKNTFIALDLVWLDGAGTVVEVRADVQPCRNDPCPSYTPAAKGRAVLEVNSGFAKAHGIAAGATLRCEGVPEFPVKGQAK